MEMPVIRGRTCACTLLCCFGSSRVRALFNAIDETRTRVLNGDLDQLISGRYPAFRKPEGNDPGRGREPGCPGPPAQIPACGFPAPGSCRRSNAIGVRGLGGPCTSDPQARSFGYTPGPALGPGLASLLTFPPAGRLPSTISDTDLRSALFGASQVLCSRPTPHLSPAGFVSSTSRRDP